MLIFCWLNDDGNNTLKVNRVSIRYGSENKNQIIITAVWFLLILLCFLNSLKLFHIKKLKLFVHIRAILPVYAKTQEKKIS